MRKRKLWNLNLAKIQELSNAKTIVWSKLRQLVCKKGRVFKSSHQYTNWKWCQSDAGLINLLLFFHPLQMLKSLVSFLFPFYLVSSLLDYFALEHLAFTTRDLIGSFLQRLLNCLRIIFYYNDSNNR